MRVVCFASHALTPTVCSNVQQRLGLKPVGILPDCTRTRLRHMLGGGGAGGNGKGRSGLEVDEDVELADVSVDVADVVVDLVVVAVNVVDLVVVTVHVEGGVIVVVSSASSKQLPLHSS